MAIKMQVIKPIFISGVIIAALLGIVFLGIQGLSDKARHNPDNPFEYDISDYQKIDSTLVRYQEIETLKVPLKQLRAVAVDPVDQIYVAGDSALLVFDRSGSLFKTIRLTEPARCLAIDDSGKIYVGTTNQVQLFDSSGTKLAEWSRLGENALLTSIAVILPDVFVADAGNKIVYRFDQSGNLLNRIGEKDTTRDIPGFIIPSPYFDVGIGHDGSLWVVNPGRHAFENYSPDGRLRTSWQKPSMSVEGFCGCCNPTHFAVLSDGSFVTSEKGIVRVKIHNQTGDFVGIVAEPAQFTEDTVGLDLAVDSTGRILILDPKKGAVRIFVTISS